jgi:hypothetical protein
MRSAIRLGVCVAALWGGAALAQERDVERERPVFRGEEQGADEGLYVLLGGGAEGYTGALAPSVNPGPAYGATVGYKPTDMLGVELGYSGGLNDIDLAGPGGTPMAPTSSATAATPPSPSG